MLHEPLRFSPQQFARKIEKVTRSTERASFFEKGSRRMKTRAAASTWRDHLPLYRRSQIFARHGVDIDRSTLANWVGGACWWLEPSGIGSNIGQFARAHGNSVAMIARPIVPAMQLARLPLTRAARRELDL